MSNTWCLGQLSVVFLAFVLTGAVPVMRREGKTNAKHIVVDSSGNVKHKQAVRAGLIDISEVTVKTSDEQRNEQSSIVSEVMEQLTDNDLVDDGLEQHEKASNYSFLLHQVDANSLVDGVLFFTNGETIAKKDLDMVCDTFKGSATCLTLPNIGVVRSSTKTLERVLTYLPPIQFASLKGNMPEIVRYVRQHLGAANVKVLLNQYESAGVKLPSTDILTELSKEHIDVPELPSST